MPIPIKISLAAARTNARKTQTDIANWETGKKKIGKAQLTMFCNLCDFPIDNIFLP